MTLLKTHNLHSFYGKSHVLQGVDINVGKGEIVSILGRNGAGRSTLVKTIMGQVKATGAIHFKGQNILGWPSHKLAHAGLGYVPEDRQIFKGMTVEQNLLLGIKNAIGDITSSSAWSLNDVYNLFPQLFDLRKNEATVLSGGQQQMLALSRTLLGNPELIMIDEPTEGLAPQLIALVASYFTALKERGISILLIEQRLTLSIELSQSVYVLGKGTIVFAGTPEEFKRNHWVGRQWLGI